MRVRHTFIDCLLEKNDEKIWDLLYFMKKYYEVKDMENHTRFFGSIFEILYFRKKKLTFEEIAFEMSIDVKNLRQHIKRMDELSIEIIKNEPKFQELSVYIEACKKQR